MEAARRTKHDTETGFFGRFSDDDRRARARWSACGAIAADIIQAMHIAVPDTVSAPLGSRREPTIVTKR
jgi:hypothetical protein